MGRGARSHHLHLSASRQDKVDNLHRMETERVTAFILKRCQEGWRATNQSINQLSIIIAMLSRITQLSVIR